MLFLKKQTVSCRANGRKTEFWLLGSNLIKLEETSGLMINQAEDLIQSECFEVNSKSLRAIEDKSIRGLAKNLINSRKNPPSDFYLGSISPSS